MNEIYNYLEDLFGFANRIKCHCGRPPMNNTLKVLTLFNADENIDR